MSEYTQGVCHDGAAVLKDGNMMTIGEIIEELRMGEEYYISICSYETAIAKIAFEVWKTNNFISKTSHVCDATKTCQKVDNLLKELMSDLSDVSI